MAFDISMDLDSGVQCHTRRHNGDQRFQYCTDHYMISGTLFYSYGCYIWILEVHWQNCRHQSNQPFPCYRSLTDVSSQAYNANIKVKMVKPSTSYGGIGVSRASTLV